MMKAKPFQEKWTLLTKYENKSVLTKKHVKIISVFANDKDALVRTEAYDSLSEFPSKNVQKFLKHAIIHESNALARSYAILSWVDITQTLGVRKKQKKFLKQLKKLPNMKKSEPCMLNFYYAKCLFGHKKSLKKLLAFLNSSDYQIRCSALNVLQDIASPENRQYIEPSLEQLLQQEVCDSVSENATELLQYIKTI